MIHDCCECDKGQEHVEIVTQTAVITENQDSQEDISVNEDDSDIKEVQLKMNEEMMVARSSLNFAIALGATHAREGILQSEDTTLELSLCLEDPKLLRGTSIVQVLRLLGAELRVNSLSKDFSHEEAMQLYGRSVEVKEIDYFISHCWQDDRFSKTVALLIHSNLWMAIFVSTIVAFSMSFLTRFKLLPVVQPEEGDLHHFPWALCTGMSTFFLVLCTWNHCRAFFCYIWHRQFDPEDGKATIGTIYFLDKFCVHQRDLPLKQQGFRSFAAFVAASKNLLLLWSPQYFTRLWCTLELAALVKSKAHLRTLPLTIIPLQLAKVSLVTWIVAFFVFALYQFNKVVGKILPDVAILISGLLLGGYCWSMSLRQYAHDRRAMHEQIGNFSVQSAKCSDPRDRSWVERSMLRWFADLEQCNQHIRKGLREQISDALGPESHFPSSLVVPIFLVNLFSEADYVAAGYYDVFTFRRTMGAIGQAAGTLSLLPASYQLCLCFARKRPQRWMEVLINCLLALAVTTMAFTMFALNFYVVGNTELGNWTVGIAVVQVLVVVWFHRVSLRVRR